MGINAVPPVSAKQVIGANMATATHMSVSTAHSSIGSPIAEEKGCPISILKSFTGYANDCSPWNLAPCALDRQEKICFSLRPMSAGHTIDYANTINAITWYLVFLFSTVCHEAAHAWTALKLGDNTAARGGQVSLNPIPHIRREPLGMVLVPLLTFTTGGWMFGWASAPYNRLWATTYPRRAAWMAVAGPAANLLLAMVAVLLMKIGIAGGLFGAPTFFSFSHVVNAGPGAFSLVAARTVSIFFSLNLLLACLNLFPLPPLDGSNLPLLVLPENLARRWMQLTAQPGLRLLGLLFVWNGFGLVFRPIYVAVVRFFFA